MPAREGTATGRSDAQRRLLLFCARDYSADHELLIHRYASAQLSTLCLALLSRGGESCRARQLSLARDHMRASAGWPSERGPWKTLDGGIQVIYIIRNYM